MRAIVSYRPPGIGMDVPSWVVFVGPRWPARTPLLETTRHDVAERFAAELREVAV